MRTRVQLAAAALPVLIFAAVATAGRATPPAQSSDAALMKTARAIHERIIALDLSRSTFDATTTPQLAAMAKFFPALRVLDVSDNFLSATDLAAIKTAFATVEVITGEQDKLSFADGNDRFASVCE